MGIELLPSTRLRDNVIERKFRGSIDTSQSFAKLIQKPPSKTLSFPLWFKKNTSKSLVDSVKHGNMIEAFAQARSQGKENAWDMYKKALSIFIGQSCWKGLQLRDLHTGVFIRQRRGD
ncbi:hypothetical protein EV368DRAFT_90030 [Lentinula lateritia]|nr:hypothetical protein EV368DRAFT_90030 [Lentinula lateritia]